MHISRLRNKFLREREQRNLKFWKTVVNPVFRENLFKRIYCISLINKDVLIRKNEDMTKTLSNFLVAL